MIVFLVLGIAMIIFAWPLAGWRLSSYFWRDLAESKLRRTDRRFRRTRVTFTVVYIIVGAVFVAVWIGGR
jgi:hypothetical protein